tara:strand:- start:705 stop:1136 length:432 start_codon:yes stop_codon:yes gene_type:complete
MKIKLISIGKTKNKHIAKLCFDYQNRIKHYAKLEEVVLKSGTNQFENDKILNHIKNNKGINFVLSEDGVAMSSKDFAKLLSNPNNQISFVIGGAEGIGSKVKANCDQIIALSSMTFTHEMAQLFLLEQLYRAFTILQNKKYHK